MNNDELQKLVDEAQDDDLTLDEKARRRATATAVTSLQTPTIEITQDEANILAHNIWWMLSVCGYIDIATVCHDEIINDLIKMIKDR